MYDNDELHAGVRSGVNLQHGLRRFVCSSGRLPDLHRGRCGHTFGTNDSSDDTIIAK